MTNGIFVKLADNHVCDFPNRRPSGEAIHVGDVWECSTCRKQSVLSDVHNSQYTWRHKWFYVHPRAGQAR